MGERVDLRPVERRRRARGTDGLPRAAPRPEPVGRPWSGVIVVASTAAVLGVTLVVPGSPLRAPVSLWFVAVCPGLAVIRLLRVPGLAVQLGLALALSLSLAGVLATAQVYAGAWSPPLTLALLVAIALAAVLVDPWLFAPGWESPGLARMEGRLVPAVLLVAAAVLELPLLALGAVADGWTSGGIAALLAGGAAATAIASFVATRSAADLYVGAILTAVAVPGILAARVDTGMLPAISALAQSGAWAIVAGARLARRGGVGWQAWVALGWLAIAGTGALLSRDLAVQVGPAALVALALGLALRAARGGTPQPAPDVLVPSGARPVSELLLPLPAVVEPDAAAVPPDPAVDSELAIEGTPVAAKPLAPAKPRPRRHHTPGPAEATALAAPPVEAAEAAGPADSGEAASDAAEEVEIPPTGKRTRKATRKSDGAKRQGGRRRGGKRRGGC